MPLTLTQITDLLNPIVMEQEKQQKLIDDLPAPAEGASPAPEQEAE
jgi:hypothetical protein